MFVGLGNLRNLYLGLNHIRLAAGTFVGLGNLQSLSLSNNQITNLPADIFVGLGNLQWLHLNQNQLTSLPADIFVGLGNLLYLYLHRNQLTNLPADIFVGLGNLWYLSLRVNQLASLSADTFEGLGNLQILFLHQNQLINLPADLFVGLGNLERLDLSRNSIRSIEAGMFNDTTQLHTLDLEYNSISTIAANIYDILASISTVDISNNPWQCDCRIAPFKQRMNGSYPFENQIICAGPGNLTGQYLRDVNPEDLICEETTAVYSMLSTKHIVDSTLSLATVRSSPFHQSAKSTSKAQTSSPTPSNAPTADSNPGWSTASTAPLFDPSIKSTSSQTSETANPSDTSPTRSTVSTDSPFGFQSTMTDSNTDDPTGDGIFLSVPFVATLCVFLGLFIISAIALTVWCMYKRRERDPNSVQNVSNSNPAGTSSGHDQIRQPAGINSQMLHHGTEDSQHIYNVPTDDVDTEYNTISEINQSEGPHQGAGNMQSLEMQNLGSFNNGYEVPSPSLCSDNGADPQAREGPQSHQYENSQVIAAAAKDAAADPQVNLYQNDDEPVDNQSQDSPNHYEPLRNPSSQQQHTYTSLLPHDLQHH
ncbi:leucine-rich repeat transmembrane neuronal protein 2-like [Branchiostoma lanceolatum]|uniref:leucine-rich repeat transmembrane neuronal protein 2-like n=1 Tax=Branchiostoma lanceolatum TaxID=7740 RepID=UPI003452B1DA